MSLKGKGFSRPRHILSGKGLESLRRYFHRAITRTIVQPRLLIRRGEAAPPKPYNDSVRSCTWLRRHRHPMSDLSTGSTLDLHPNPEVTASPEDQLHALRSAVATARLHSTGWIRV